MRSLLVIAAALGTLFATLGGAAIAGVCAVLGVPAWASVVAGAIAASLSGAFGVLVASFLPLPAPPEPERPDLGPLAAAIEALARPGPATPPEGLPDEVGLALRRAIALLTAERRAVAVREADLRQAAQAAPMPTQPGRPPDASAIAVLERELVELEKRHRASLQVRDAFLARMSHELRTPLNAILGYVELLLEEVHGDAADDAGRIRTSALNLLALVTTLLDLTQLQSGSYEVAPEPVQLEDLVRRVVDSVRAEADAHGNTVEVAVDPALIATLDRRMVQSILFNLVSNACKYTANGRVSIEAGQVEQRLRMVVRDSGIGLTERQIQEAFAPFQQADESTTRRYDGAGLGLAVVRGFAEAMGGRVGIESVLGKGATVTVELPMVVEARTGGLGEGEDEPTLLLR